MISARAALPAQAGGAARRGAGRPGRPPPPRALHHFEDSVDIGDGWYHGQALAGKVRSSAVAHARVALVHSGPHLATLRIQTALWLPARFNTAEMARSEEMVELPVDSRLSLRRGSDQIEIETTLRNTAADHRPRMLFPSGARSEHMLSDGAFDVVRRRSRWRRPPDRLNPASQHPPHRLHRR